IAGELLHSAKIFRSTNLVDWQTVFVGEQTWGSTLSFFEISYLHDRFVVCGGFFGNVHLAGDPVPSSNNGPTSGGSIMTSSDGLNWIVRSPQQFDWFEAAAYGNGRFVVSGHWGVAYSENGTDWTYRNTIFGGPDFKSIVFANDRFTGSGIGLYTSPDGISW